MVLDTSAIMALLLAEPEARAVAEALESTAVAVVAAPTLVEVLIVVEAKLGPQGVLDLQRILGEAAVAVVPFDVDDAAAAVDAWRRFGKGRDRASLNLGDCSSYALAARRAEPLLFVGDDFAATDIAAALSAGSTRPDG